MCNGTVNDYRVFYFLGHEEVCQAVCYIHHICQSLGLVRGHDAILTDSINIETIWDNRHFVGVIASNGREKIVLMIDALLERQIMFQQEGSFV